MTKNGTEGLSLYAEVAEDNKIICVDSDLDVLKKNADDDSRIVSLHEIPLENENIDLAQAYAEKDSEGNILAIWNDKDYVDDDLLEGSHTILLQEE